MRQTIIWLSLGFLNRSLLHLAEFLSPESGTFRALVISSEAYDGLSGFCVAVIYYWSREEAVGKLVARCFPFAV